MRILCILMSAALLTSACCNESAKESKKMLRHVVLFGFNDDLSAEQVKEVETDWKSVV